MCLAAPRPRARVRARRPLPTCPARACAVPSGCIHASAAAAWLLWLCTGEAMALLQAHASPHFCTVSRRQRATAFVYSVPPHAQGNPTHAEGVGNPTSWGPHWGPKMRRRHPLGALSTSAGRSGVAGTPAPAPCWGCSSDGATCAADLLCPLPSSGAVRSAGTAGAAASLCRLDAAGTSGALPGFGCCAAPGAPRACGHEACCCCEVSRCWRRSSSWATACSGSHSQRRQQSFSSEQEAKDSPGLQATQPGPLESVLSMDVRPPARPTGASIGQRADCTTKWRYKPAPLSCTTWHCKPGAPVLHHLALQAGGPCPAPPGTTSRRPCPAPPGTTSRGPLSCTTWHSKPAPLSCTTWHYKPGAPVLEPHLGWALCSQRLLTRRVLASPHPSPPAERSGVLNPPP